MTRYSRLADARSYFGVWIESASSSELELERARLAGEPAHILEAFETLVAFGELVRSVPSELRRLLATKTALEHLFDHPECSYGELALTVYRRHPRAGSRNRRVLDRLERAGVFSTTIELENGERRVIARLKSATKVELPAGAFACNPDESAGMREALEEVAADVKAEIRGELEPELGPGERLVDGRRLYSAAWLDAPKLVVGALVVALGLLLAPAAIADPVPVPPPATIVVGPPPGPGVVCHSATLVSYPYLDGAPKTLTLVFCFRAVYVGPILKGGPTHLFHLGRAQ